MKKLFKTAVLGLSAAALLPSVVNAAPKFYFGDGKELEIFFMNQLWAVYTMDRVEKGTKYDNRTDFFLRRSRVGFQGKINEDLSWRVWFAYDNVGLDPHTGLAKNNNIGLVGANSGNTQFYLWDAYFTYTLNPKWVNITVGYFRPQVGRESITAGFEVNSFEKALTNFYPRQHIVGTGPGRETGINIGGLYNDDKTKLGLNYNFGIFNTDKFNSGSGGDNLLYTARVAVSYGDPEMKKYGLGYKVNYFGKRNGVTVAFNYAYQGRGQDTNSFPLAPSVWSTYLNANVPKIQFKNNQLLGIDILANYKDFNFNFEYDELKRNFDVSKLDYKDKVWHVRAGYNFTLPNKTVLEPAITYAEWKGDATSLNGNGKYKVTDIGLSWYIKQNNLKFNLHYVNQDGSANSAYAGTDATKNKAGDYIGVGLQLIF
ncbi:MAG: OprO/OprP family phosphate-selective porin [Hydrogenothermaceae bacterium]|nr:OprO/OprP family phosphate-selective porin [Hydrogenothermaceae bacterium]